MELKPSLRGFRVQEFGLGFGLRLREEQLGFQVVGVQDLGLQEVGVALK